ncbi:MAG: ubiquinone anaerobic biosynthesis protein UbiV [Burkholderiales bacterium]
MKLALGPVLYYWSRETLLQFYDEIARTPVDIVYLGETVCSRRHTLRTDDWFELAERLAQAGKEVVLSTQALLESESDLKILRKLAANGRFLVEANDMGAVRLLASTPFALGPHINLYNPGTLNYLAMLGARRWVAPLEMSRLALQTMQRQRPQRMETEVFAYGRMPLAFSARCFTARHHNLPKDDCQFRCLDYPDGLTLRTREGRPFLTLNGIQTQSAGVYNLICELAGMRVLGVNVVRISPQAHHTEKIIRLFRDCLEGELAPQTAADQMTRLMPGHACDGFWHGRPGLEQVGQGRP